MKKYKKTDKEKTPRTIPKDKIDIIVEAYCTPGSKAFSNKAECLRLAGYAESTAKARVSEYFNNPQVKKAIKNYQCDIGNVLLLGYRKAIDLKIKAQDLDLNSYYRTLTETDVNTGEVRTYQELIPLDELTPEQRELITNVTYQSGKGIPSYSFIDKDKASADLIRLYKEYMAKMERNTKDESETTEIILENIKDKVSASVKIIKKSDDMAAAAGVFVERPDDLDEED